MGGGRKFSYSIATGMGGATDFVSDDYRGDLSVKDLDGYELTTINYSGSYGAAYVLFSHGKDGLRAWLPNVINPAADAELYIITDAATTDALMGVELENVDADSQFIQDYTSQHFDDIVRFKTKAELVAPRHRVSWLRIMTRACHSAEAVLDTQPWPTGAGNFATDYANHASAIVTAATALNTLCNSDAAPLADTCARNLVWEGPSDGRTYEDCHCATADEFYRTGFGNENFGWCE